MTEVSADVLRGAAWLDDARPGWEREVDTATLQMNSGSQCVLGQVFRPRLFDPRSWFSHGFENVYYGLQKDADWMSDHGFLSSYHEDDWVNLITARRGATS